MAGCRELHSRVRLVSGRAEAERGLAGIEIAFDPGFKTYWRSPGESGLPPRFDWSGSENVKWVDVRWPALARSEDAAGISYVYHDTVLLPVVVEAQDPSRPVRLNLGIEYGICKDICIPAHARLERTLGVPPDDHARIESVLHTKVPRVQAVGATQELSVLSVQSSPDQKAAFTALLQVPAGTKPDLFVEAPEGWYFSAAAADERNHVAVTLDEKPTGATSPISVTLTLVAGQNSVESTVKLDADGKPR